MRSKSDIRNLLKRACLTVLACLAVSAVAGPLGVSVQGSTSSDAGSNNPASGFRFFDWLVGSTLQTPASVVWSTFLPSTRKAISADSFDPATLASMPVVEIDGSWRTVTTASDFMDSFGGMQVVTGNSLAQAQSDAAYVAIDLDSGAYVDSPIGKSYAPYGGGSPNPYFVGGGPNGSF